VGLLGCERRRANDRTGVGPNEKKKRKRRSGLLGLEWAMRRRKEKKRNIGPAGPSLRKKRIQPQAGFQYRKDFSISNLF
jgi:hypothetical protein